jgi:hypothetical protein
VQQRHELTALDEAVTYSPRLVTRKPCRGKGTSELLTTEISRGQEGDQRWWGKYDDDGDLGAVQAGPLIARRRCSQGWQGPCVCDGGVWGQESRSMAVPRVGNQSSPRFLPMAAATGLSHDQEGSSILSILRERRAVRFGSRVMPRRV